MRSYFALDPWAGEGTFGGAGSALLQVVEGGENLLAMLVGIDAGVSTRDLALRIDDESVAGSNLGDSEIHQRTVGAHDFMIGVGQQLKIQAFLGTELLVRIDAVHADP